MSPLVALRRAASAWDFARRNPDHPDSEPGEMCPSEALEAAALAYAKETIAAAEERGRRAGLEAAAKVCEEWSAQYMEPSLDVGEVVAAIRALAEPGRALTETGKGEP